MPDESGDEGRSGRRPGHSRRWSAVPPRARRSGAQTTGLEATEASGKGGPSRQGALQRPGSLRLAPIGDNRFELVHPRASGRRSSITRRGWRSGRPAIPKGPATPCDTRWPPAATISGSTSALGRIALEEFRDPSLARGHFGYAVELGRRALPPQFAGRLPADRPSNRPFYDAIDGLIRSLEALGRHDDSAGPAQPSGIGCRAAARSGRRRGVEDGPIQECEKGRRRGAVFFDFRNFSDLQGFADRDRTTAERDPQAEGMAWHSRPLHSCRRKGSRTSMSTWFRDRSVRVILESIRGGDGRCRPRSRPARGVGLMIVRSIAGGVEVLAPAKLNLFLEVLGRRPDGYHEIEIADGRREPVRHLDLHRRPVGRDQPAVQRSDLAGRAVTTWWSRRPIACEAATGCRRGARIVLDKAIPAQAGLAGGSSDAAATLAALDRLWDLRTAPGAARCLGGGDRQRRGRSSTMPRPRSVAAGASGWRRCR